MSFHFYREERQLEVTLSDAREARRKRAQQQRMSVFLPWSSKPRAKKDSKRDGKKKSAKNASKKDANGMQVAREQSVRRNIHIRKSPSTPGEHTILHDPGTRGDYNFIHLLERAEERDQQRATHVSRSPAICSCTSSSNTSFPASSAASSPISTFTSSCTSSLERTSTTSNGLRESPSATAAAAGWGARERMSGMPYQKKRPGKAGRVTTPPAAPKPPIIPTRSLHAPAPARALAAAATDLDRTMHGWPTLGE